MPGGLSRDHLGLVVAARAKSLVRKWYGDHDRGVAEPGFGQGTKAGAKQAGLAPVTSILCPIDDRGQRSTIVLSP